MGTALGDALGLPAEGMTAKGIARRFGRLDRFRLVGSLGFVSDDTEQSALIAQSLLRHPDDPERCARAFQRSLLGWFCRLPWGIGWGTVRACCRIALGFRPSGVRSAGNGAAMRAAIVGMFFQDRDQAGLRLAFGRSLAQVTHRDERAVEGALYVAELAAACGRSRVNDPDRSLAACQTIARAVVTHRELGPAIDRARDLALAGASVPEAASQCGTSGYIVHTAAFATFCFLRRGDEPMTALGDAIAAGVTPTRLPQSWAPGWGLTMASHVGPPTCSPASTTVRSARRIFVLWPSAWHNCEREALDIRQATPSLEPWCETWSSSRSSLVTDSGVSCLSESQAGPRRRGKRSAPSE